MNPLTQTLHWEIQDRKRRKPLYYCINVQVQLSMNPLTCVTMYRLYYHLQSTLLIQVLLYVRGQRLFPFRQKHTNRFQVTKEGADQSLQPLTKINQKVEVFGMKINDCVQNKPRTLNLKKLKVRQLNRKIN